MKYLIFLLFPISAFCQPITVLFDIEKNETIGSFRQGHYLIDGQPASLLPNQKELIVQYTPIPPFDSQTEKVKSVFAMQGNNYTQSWIIEQKTQAEIYAEFKATVPAEITKRQATLGMYLYLGIEPENILQFIQNNITDPTQQKIALIEWNYTAAVERNNPLVNTFAQTLNLTERQIDEFFINCEKL